MYHLPLLRPLLRAVRVRRQRGRARQTGQSGHKAGASTVSTAPAITTSVPWTPTDDDLENFRLALDAALNKTPPVHEAAFPGREPPQAPPGPGERELYAREQYDLDNPGRKPA